MDRVKITRWMFFINAAIWMLIGLASLARLDENRVTPMTIQLIIALLIFGNAGAMFACGWRLGRRRKLVYLFALGVTLINILLTFTDQVGALDLLTLGLDLAILAGLIAIRKDY